MSHLITDAESSILTIKFTNNGDELAVLRIAQSSGVRCRTCNHVPPYVDLESSINIDYITDKKQIDQLTPIQVYCGHETTIPRILLLEETEYDIELEIKNDNVSDELMYLFKNDQMLIVKVNRFENNNKHKLLTLYSKSYVGKGFFDIEIGNETLEIPFEMRSKKIDYLQDYPQMLEDIAGFSTALLLDPSSPLYRNYNYTFKTKKTLYEDFLILEYVFGKCNFEKMYEHVRNDLHRELLSDVEEIVNGSVSSIDNSSIIKMLSSDNLAYRHNGLIKGQYDPMIIHGTVYRETYDMPENRVIKDLLLTIQSMVYAIDNSTIKKKSAYIAEKLDYMKSTIDDYVCDQWLSDINLITYIPFESTILRGKYGYAELFSIYQILNMGVAISQKDASDLLDGHNKKVYLVYEYWCYFKLYECLYQLSSNKPQIQPVFDAEKKYVSIHTGKPIVFSIQTNDTAFNVQLYYNSSFNQKSVLFRSYSLKLRPDFTLLIDDGKTNYVINFDSKYKVSIKDPDDTQTEDAYIETGCWEYDVYKMHTYRDAIVKSLGSYILYPGKKDDEEDWEKYIKPLEPKDWPVHNNGILPSVGAISLTPGLNNNNQLNNAIRLILDNISKKTGELFFN